MRFKITKLPKIGMRTVKTAFAVYLCLIIGQLVNGITPFYSAIAAIFTMKDTQLGSVNYGKTRLFSTLVGGVVGILFLWIGGSINQQAIFDIIIAVGIICCIYICNYFGRNNSASLACVVFLAVILNHNNGNEKYVYAFTRMVETLIGIVIAIGVNKYICPLKEENVENI